MRVEYISAHSHLVNLANTVFQADTYPNSAGNKGKIIN